MKKKKNAMKRITISRDWCIDEEQLQTSSVGPGMTGVTTTRDEQVLKRGIPLPLGRVRNVGAYLVLLCLFLDRATSRLSCLWPARFPRFLLWNGQVAVPRWEVPWERISSQKRTLSLLPTLRQIGSHVRMTEIKKEPNKSFRGLSKVHSRVWTR